MSAPHVPGCPCRLLPEHVTSKWGVLVLLRLGGPGTLRWAELKRSVEGVSEKKLILTLRTLEVDGLVLREPSRWCRPTWSTPSPTTAGRPPLLAPLVAWTLEKAG
ncbi:helix-turn-helix domain-containing protein [uncultured Nocardioides sp.]|uniref:HTH hxlR-type domain-containing protein n=1 Tax=uncultured Nocardioides sp. TaxID=198441 RepID=A0A6J4PBJ5_9ACTN|nr:winged helix-turn-helix transcriptional regulator [uncultured Nocardioides sp.]CAA9405549.1 MAG: hypothetical protein AVDCRST_MAG06-2498 [uncultured Nocardioides sp.]